MEPRNFIRGFAQVRRRAAARHVRPLPFKSSRHTYATLALISGKNPVWVSRQLGHSDPAFTLRTYAHVLPQDYADLSFADFGVPKRPGRN